MVDIIMKMPPWYLLSLSVFSLYYAIRGIMEKMAHHKGGSYNKTQRVIIAYIQEFLFKVIFTVSSFMALFMANHIFSSLESINDISTGTAILLIFLILWGITGVAGHLTFLIVSGKFPSLK